MLKLRWIWIWIWTWIWTLGYERKDDLALRIRGKGND